MESMTGYAFIEQQTKQFSFSISLKSINSKYQEVNYNFPRILKNKEDELLKHVKQEISRGKLEVNIDIYDWQIEREVTINRDLLQQYIAELENVQKKMSVNNGYSLDTLLTLDGVVKSSRASISDKSYTTILKALDKVVKQNITMRKNEGAATKNDMLSAVKKISDNVNAIEKLSSNVSQFYFQKIKERLEKITTNTEIDQNRLYTEVALLADKLDINEEIVRLKDHIKKFKEITKDNGQIGRKLDFVAQEMFREINTIASKSNNSEISFLAVEVKNNIDKIREQCRNII